MVVAALPYKCWRVATARVIVQIVYKIGTNFRVKGCHWKIEWRRAFPWIQSVIVLACRTCLKSRVQVASVIKVGINIYTRFLSRGICKLASIQILVCMMLSMMLSLILATLCRCNYFQIGSHSHLKHWLVYVSRPSKQDLDSRSELVESGAT